MIINYKVAWDKTKLDFLKKYDVKIDDDGNIMLIGFNNLTVGYQEIIDFARLEEFFIVEKSEFSEDEMARAEWFAIDVVWTNLYPYPPDKFKYLETTYDLTNYCRGNEPKYFCRMGKVQNNSFYIEKDSRWATRNIMHLNWITEELFVSDKCKQRLEESTLAGYSFRTVYKKDKSEANIFQLTIEKVIPKCLNQDNFEHVYTCPVCKKTKYFLKNGFIRVDKSSFKNIDVDIAKSEEKIGEINADSLLFISKKFYIYLNENKLARGMKFIPLILE